MIKATTISSFQGHEPLVIVRKKIMIEFCVKIIEKKNLQYFINKIKLCYTINASNFGHFQEKKIKFWEAMPPSLTPSLFESLMVLEGIGC